MTNLVSGSRQVSALGLGCLLLKCSTQPAIESPRQVPRTFDYSHQPDGSQSILHPGPTQGRTPSYQFQFCNAASITLIMGTESDTVMLDNPHILMWLSAGAHFIEFNTVLVALRQLYLKIIISDYITCCTYTLNSSCKTSKCKHHFLLLPLIHYTCQCTLESQNNTNYAVSLSITFSFLYI